MGLFHFSANMGDRYFALPAGGWGLVTAGAFGLGLIFNIRAALSNRRS